MYKLLGLVLRRNTQLGQVQPAMNIGSTRKRHVFTPPPFLCLQQRNLHGFGICESLKLLSRHLAWNWGGGNSSSLLSLARGSEYLS